MRAILIMAFLFYSGFALARKKVPVVALAEDFKHLKEVKGERVFEPTLKDGCDARADLPRYVWSQMKRTKDKSQLRRWREVLLKQPAYVWRCHGVIEEGSRFVTCTIRRYDPALEPHDGLHLGEVFDGGTDFCEATFSLKIRRLIIVRCNGES